MRYVTRYYAPSLPQIAQSLRCHDAYSLFLDILCFSLFIITLTNLLAHSSKCQHHNNIFVTLLAFTSLQPPSTGQSHALLNYSPQIFMQIFSRIVGWSEAASSANLGPGCPQHTTYKIQTTKGVSASMPHDRAHASQTMIKWEQKLRFHLMMLKIWVTANVQLP